MSLHKLKSGSDVSRDRGHLWHGNDAPTLTSRTSQTKSQSVLPAVEYITTIANTYSSGSSRGEERQACKRGPKSSTRMKAKQGSQVIKVSRMAFT